MKKTRVAILYGGKGHEHQVSLSGHSFVRANIDTSRYELLSIYIARDGVWRIGGPTGEEVILSTSSGLTSGGEPLGVEVAFPLLHGDYGEDGSPIGALKSVGIAYVGCDICASAVALDKILTKRVAEAEGIPVVKSVFFTERDDIAHTIKKIEDSIGYPVFIKPSSLGSSVGAGVANTRGELINLVTSSLALDKRGLAEVYLEKRREIEVAYLDTPDDTIVAGYGEVITDTWYDYDKKYGSNGARTDTSADVGSDADARIQDYTRRLARLIGVRQIARFDYFIEGDEVYLNEINTMPGFTKSSLYPRLIERYGIPPTELFTLLIEGAAR